MYQKIRFTDPRNGATAGLILDSDKLAKMSVSDASQLFPYYESAKMTRFETSPEYETWEQAFAHCFA